MALLYVAQGQDDESSLLKNSTSSVEYQEFVSSMGWQVDLATHPGYKGGLEENMMVNGQATYFCTSSLEIIFHDVTKMITDQSDPRQLKKKRHIGNDHVHIVFNESSNNYRYDTIGGDFGNAQIIINPLSNGLFTIDVYRDAMNSVDRFGTLMERSVVSKAGLGPLVRFTAVNAFRSSIAAGNQQTAQPHPYEIRKDTIEIISSRHAIGARTFENYMNQLLNEHVVSAPPGDVQ